MIGMWFSFNQDASCLCESVKVFRNTFTDAVITICDDNNNPIDKEVIDLINPDHYCTREWDSLGNLNGWNAVYGILNHQVSMHKLFPGHKGAIKVDCDALIFNNDWIDEDRPICGLDLGTSRFIAGLARYVRADSIPEVIEFLDNKFKWNTSRVPEDQVIANSYLYLYGKLCRLNNWEDYAFSYSFKNVTLNNKIKSVVNFGNRHEIDIPGCKRNIAGSHMANYSKVFL